MIHTMTIFKEINSYEAQHLLSCMGYSISELEALAPATWKDIHPMCGISDVTLDKSSMSLKYYGIRYDRYTIYLRMEPLTLVTGEQHIALFECTPQNIKRLENAFRASMVVYLGLDGTSTSMNEIAELSTWKAQRVDYTWDIRLKNHDEVLALMNLFKMSEWQNIDVKSPQHQALNPTSIYGDHFYDSSFLIGNKTWEIAGYDKGAQVKSKKGSCNSLSAEAHNQELVEEAQNVLRLEYRRKTNGTKKSSTRFESRSVMEFLSEDVASKWFHKAYGSIIGYEPFYILYYQLQLKIAEAFPLTKKEAAQERHRKAQYDKEKAAAAKSGRKIKPFKRRILGQRAQEYYDFMTFVARHKGLQNALEAFDDFRWARKRAFPVWLRNIREKIHVSPVGIPHNWLYKRPNGNGRDLDIPADFLPNPVPRPVQ